MTKNLYIIPAFVFALSLSAHAKTTTVTSTLPKINNSVRFMPVPNCDPHDGCPGCPNGGSCPSISEANKVTPEAQDRKEEVAAVSLWSWYFNYQVSAGNTGGVTGSW